MGKVALYLKVECESTISESPYSNEYRKGPYADVETLATQLKDVPPAKVVAAKTSTTCFPNGD